MSLKYQIIEQDGEQYILQRNEDPDLIEYYSGMKVQDTITYTPKVESVSRRSAIIHFQGGTLQIPLGLFDSSVTVDDEVQVTVAVSSNRMAVVRAEKVE